MSSSKWIGRSLGGRYRVEALLGQGGMSAVYKATDPNLNRTVAVKLIHPHLSEDTEFINRFREEANVVAQLRHRNIVQVFDFNRDGDEFYMVMEFVAGETLRDRLDRLNKTSNAMPLSEVVRYATGVCDAADYAHRRNLIHRDIKPANVMLDTEGQAVLMDFGIAKIIGGPQYTATGATLGTALYMPPEQIRGERVDNRSDVYSIGVMLYEMIAGRPPFQAASPMTLSMMHVSDPVPDIRQLRPDCPVDLKAVAEKAMAKEPDHRFQSAAEMKIALERVLAAVQKSHQAATIAGGAAIAATDPARTSRSTQAAGTRVPATGRVASNEATALPQSQLSKVARATAVPGAPPTQEYQPPEVVTGTRPNLKVLLTCGLLLFLAIVLTGGVLLTLLIVNRTGDGDGDSLAALESTKAPALVATDMATATAQLLPSPTPAPVETQAAAESLPAPTETPVPSPTPAPGRLGLLVFTDNDQARSGSFQLSINEASPPAADSHYELWLSDGQTLLSVGPIETGSGLQMIGDSVENLLAIYNTALITIEPDDRAGDGPTGEPIYVGTVPLASLEQIRLLVAGARDTPERKAYLAGAEEQALLAIDHSGFQLDSLAAGDLSSAQQHAEHVNNILSGEGNSAFGDVDGDGLSQNPGDGFGVTTYLERAREHAQSAAGADGATQEVILHSEHTIIAINNALASLEDAIQANGRVLASDTAAEAQPSAELVAAVLEQMLDGIDANDDGIIAPVPGEGGILLAYEHALKMGSFEFFQAGDLVTGTEE